MKRNNILTLIAVSCLMVAGASCERQEPETSFDADNNLERVPVTLYMDVAEIEDGTPGTKAIQEPEVSGVTSDSQISNFVVLQFSGTDSDATLVGQQVYYDHWPLNGYRETTDPLYDETDVLTLVASATPNTVVVLANTFAQIALANDATLGEFLANDYTTIYELSGVFTTTGGNDYLRMSGSKVLPNVTTGADVSVALKRNVAKIVVNVTNATYNKTGDNKVTISKVHLRDINGKYYYCAHVAAALSPLEFTDTYSATDPRRFDNPMEDFPAEKNPGGASQGTAQQYVYYVPANLRGTTGSTAQSTKADGAPAGSTYFCLYGTYGVSNTSIVYTYYLGENLTNDFNLKPNYKYTYNITVNSKGNADYDHRIDDLREITFSTDANCYMVHPPKLEGQARTYAFPVRRAAVFWNINSQGLYGAATGDYAGYAMDSGTQWEPVIIWSDFNMSAYMSGTAKFLAVDAGTGFDPTNALHTQPYLKVRISHGMSGNVVVGIRPKGGSDILWSWHIWITDYDPDVPMTKVAGQYIYTVPGGEIHRYNNAAWNTGTYKNGFAMDRNLGARNTRYGENNGNGLYYQFGRKDPFASKSTFYLGGTTSANVLDGGRAKAWNHTDMPSDHKNVRYSVIHPDVYICGNSSNYNWTVSADDLGDGGSTSYRWNDRMWNRTGDPDRHELNKSIYDPCPPGWKVPVNGTWAGFNVATASTETTGTYTTTWSSASSLVGRYYYPEGYVNRATTGSIFYPASGIRYNASGGFYYVGSYGHYWSSYLLSATYGYNLRFDSADVSPSNGSLRTTGFTVRCLRE